MKLGIRLQKAVVGYSRGGAHKYIRRVRINRGGKLAWKYYYPDDVAKQRARAQAEKEAQRGNKAAQEVLASDSGLMSDFVVDHPELRSQRTPLDKLDVPTLQGKLGWKSPPQLVISETANQEHHKVILDHGEPPDLNGSPMSVHRALDLAFDRIPPKIRKYLDGAVSKVEFLHADEDPQFGKEPTWVGYAQPNSMTDPTKGTAIKIAADRVSVQNDNAQMGGGLPMVQIILHEFAHAIHNQIGAQGIPKRDGWPGPNWEDWLKALGPREEWSKHAVTSYAMTDEKEMFAETLTAALMYPHQLALQSERLYSFMRELLGPEAMPPLRTDMSAKARLNQELEAEKKKATPDPAVIRRIMHDLDELTGVLDMPPNHPKLRWWQGRETRVQSLLRAAPRVNHASPSNRATFHPDDKFYEMNVGARTIFMRIGPRWDAKANDFAPTTWTPHGTKDRLLAGNIKEIYDEDGNPLSNQTAWWHLHQDIIGDRDVIPPEELVGRAGKDFNAGDLVSFSDPISSENMAVRNTMSMHEVLMKIARDSDKNLAARPVEISADDFRQRSGTFTYDRWYEPGADLIEKMKAAAPGTPEHKALVNEYLRHQPYVERTPVRVTQWHVDKGLHPASHLGRVVATLPGLEDGLPVLTKKRFINPNPDGSQTVIEAERAPDGRYYLADEMWRQLLTPNGEDIKDAADLQHLCVQAMEARIGDPPRPRTAWISVKTDTKNSDTAHYYHLQVEFDGRGQPKILGGEWAHILGVSEPRIDDLLKGGAVDEAGREKKRAYLPAERIKLKKAPPRTFSRQNLPQPNDRLALTVSTEELKLKTKGKDRTVIVRLDRILPAKKAGEVPSPPGWDRMPEGYDTPYPHPSESEVAAGWKESLTAKEQELRDQGLLPSTYAGRPAERGWFRDVFMPAYQEWNRTKDKLTAMELPERYIFIGESGGGAGRKTFIRYGADAVLDTAKPLLTGPTPEPLKKTPLIYVHQELDPVTGEPMYSELRMLPPSEGRLNVWTGLASIPGLSVTRDKDGVVQHIRVLPSGLPGLRRSIGALSLTADAELQIKAYAEQMRQEAELSAETAHKIPLEEIDPAALAKRGVEVNPILPDGSEFKLALHQRELIQKSIDNDGRIFAAHFMGTGKTVSSIVGIKTMMAMKDPDDPTKPHKYAPKRVLVVAPLNTVEQWRQAAFDFDGGATVVGADSSHIPADKWVEMVQAGQDQNDIVIVGPEYFAQNEKLLREHFDGIVVDEAHLGIKNETKRNKVVSAWNENMKMFWMLSGTPITQSPADVLEYIKILSKGEVWGGYTRAQLEEEYLEESAVPAEAGVKGRKGPKVQIKASKRDELAAILSKWMHVAMAKDVKGKTLPAVRMEESQHAHMVGIQAQLYAMQLAALSDAERGRLAENAALSADEAAGLSKEARAKVQAAKAIANCVAYKPASDEREISYTVETVAADGSRTSARVPFRTFGINWLKTRPDIKNAKLRKRLAGRWPPMDELTPEQLAIYDTYFSHVFGAGTPQGHRRYGEVAGTKITAAQFAAMSKPFEHDGVTIQPWGENGTTIPNRDFGPVGIRCRGISTKRDLTEEEAALVQRAQSFRRLFQNILQTPIADPEKPKSKPRPPLVEDAMRMACEEFGVDLDEAEALMGMPVEFYDHKPVIEYGGVRVTTNDEWVSDTRGSHHLLVRKEDWDFDANKPKSAGGFEKVKDTDLVDVSGNYAWLKKPKDADDDWEPPTLRYEARHGELPGQRVAVRVMDGPEEGELKWVRKKDVSARVRTLMDPGMRDERRKADVAMVVGNAKAEELTATIEQFFMHTGNGAFEQGEYRNRSMLIFANSILDGCRMAEATLRLMGFKDVNEAIEGSPHYDPSDPGPSPNGKYFVTYIGSTYTGDRELNVEISKKVKDKLGRDTNESLFVHKIREGRKWKLWASQKAHSQIKLAQYSAEQRARIFQQFKIRAPEAHFTDDAGRKLYFYGVQDKITIPGHFVPVMEKVKNEDGTLAKDPTTGATLTRPKLDKNGRPMMQPLVVNGSEGLLREITLTGDPDKMAPEHAEAARSKLEALGRVYEDLVRKHAVADEPLTAKQMNVFNNCEVMVLSDAAQVGTNLGHASEMVMVDSLASPMAEMQRITRAARMLPPAVRDELMNKYIAEIRGAPVEGTAKYASLSTDPDHPSYTPGAKRIDHLWSAMQGSGKRPAAMSYAEYRERAKANGAEPETEDEYKRRALMTRDEERDADRVTWEVNGKVAVVITDRDGDEHLHFVDRADVIERDGPFRRIRDALEPQYLDPGRAGAPPPGRVLGARLAGGPPAEKTFQEFLGEIAELAAERAAETNSADQRLDWQTIAARARSAATLGVTAAKAALEEFRETKMPGGDRNLIDFQGLNYRDPMEGTYGLRTAAERAAGVAPTELEQEINEPVRAIREMLNDHLTARERDIIENAGFIEQGGRGFDATEIYLALRAQEVLDHIERKRPEVAATMRASAGGKVVTDNDVMNAIIDELSPLDRAVLKAKKYLVNVKRLGVSAVVPQKVTAKTMNPETGRPMNTQVFVGYERQHPVATERNTRATGRSRAIPVEQLLTAIQQGVKLRTGLEFGETTASDIANASRLDPVTKSLVFEARIFNRLLRGR